MATLIFIAVTVAALFVACLNSSVFLAYGVFSAHDERTAIAERPLARIAIWFILYGGVCGAALGALVVNDLVRQSALPYVLAALAAPPTVMAAIALHATTSDTRVAAATGLGGGLASAVLLTTIVRFDPQSLFFAVLGASFVWHACCAAALLQWARRTRLRGDRHCRACGYSLEGLESSICPECGEQATTTIAKTSATSA